MDRPTYMSNLKEHIAWWREVAYEKKRAEDREALLKKASLMEQVGERALSERPAHARQDDARLLDEVLTIVNAMEYEGTPADDDHEALIRAMYAQGERCARIFEVDLDHLEYLHNIKVSDLSERMLRGYGRIPREKSTFYREIQSRLGRPSRGRSVRLQASITPELADWLESQRGDGSISDVAFRLLEELHTKKEEA